MESLWRRTLSSVFLILSLNNVRVICQNGVSGPASFSMEPIKDYSAVTSGCTSPKLMNTIMNYAAAKGVLPELVPFLQSISPDQQRPQIYQNVQPIGIDYTQAPACTSSPQSPSFAAVPQLNIVMPNSNCPPPSVVPTCYLPPSAATPLPTFTLPPELTPVPFVQPVPPQVLSPQNYPLIPPGMVRQAPVISSQPCNQIENCFPSAPLPEVALASPNFQVTNLPQVSPATDVGTFSATIGSQSGVVKDSQLPINLQINVPAPSAPAPKITIITTAPPEQTSTTPSFMGNYFPPYGMYPPYPMPVVMERPRSKLRSWLPILLVALFTRDGGCWEGSGCCNCCCSCNCESSNIPIPYPIPIPTNNQIVMSNPYPRSPRKRGSRRDVYDRFDSKED